MVKGFWAAVGIAVLAVVAVPGTAVAGPDLPDESRFLAVPLLHPSIAAENGIPVRPCLPDVLPTAGDVAPEALPDLQAPAAAEERSLLISARLREKYRPFRESLTSP